MAVYTVSFYDYDPVGIIPTSVGNTFVWNGPATQDGTATITDNESGVQGLTLDDDSAGGESATADVTVGGNTSTGSNVDAERTWTLLDTETGLTFQVVEFDVENGSAAGDYTLSEIPLVPGRTYEVIEYDSNPNVVSGDPVFTYDDFSDLIVSGTSGNETIDSSYTGDPEGDVVDGGDGTGTAGHEDLIHAGAGDDSIVAGLENDTVFGEAGADTIDAGAGDDIVYGDASPSDIVSESLNWDAQGADGTDLTAGFTQDTGTMDVTVSFTDDGNNSPIQRVESSDTVYVGTNEPFDPNSSLYLYGNGDADTSTTTIDFAAGTGSGMTDEVQNVSFRINDVDWGSGNHTDTITVTAYDADGNPVPVTITPTGGDTVSGNTITANNVANSASDADGSVLIEIAGPVSSIEIAYSNGQSGTQAIWVTDVHFDTIPDTSTGGADSIDGGAGNDNIFGEVGADTIEGGEGDDTVDGGAGADVITDTGTTQSDDSLTGGGGADSISAGAGADTLRGDAGDDTLIGGAGADTMTGGADNDSLTGGAGDDTLDGGTGDDTLEGGTGADLMTGGTGNDAFTVAEGDTATGGDGDDYFTLTDLGEAGSAAISITGGEGNETNGDTLQLTPDVSYADITFTNTDDAAGGLSGNFTLTDGTVVTFTEIENIICFTPGTRILTGHGERPIENLKLGDLVVTRDHGLQPLRWIGKRTVPATGRFAPISIASSVLEGSRCNLLVSPQHRILYSGYQAQLLFGDSEVLVAATHLVDGHDVRVTKQDSVTYIHLMFDRHEVIYAEGIAAESFHAGEAALSAVSDAAREEMFEIFPEMRTAPGYHRETARPCLKKHEARLLMTTLQPDRPSDSVLMAG